MITELKGFLKKFIDWIRLVWKDDFSRIIVLFNLGYLVYFIESMRATYLMTGDYPTELIVPTISVFGGELTLSAMLTVFKRKYSSKDCEIEGDDSVG